MHKVKYYHADTGTYDITFSGSLTSAKKELDHLINSSNSGVKRVAALRVDFRNGDYARIINMNPLSAMMLEERFYDSSDLDSDSIFS